MKTKIPAAKTFKVKILEDGKFISSETSIVIEKDLPIYVNGEHLATASVAPSLERELVVGYLFGQGFIENAGEITKLEITAKGVMAVLATTDTLANRQAKTSYRIVSGGGRTAYFETSTLPRIVSGLKVAKEDIFRAMNLLFENASLYGETGGVHSAALFDAGRNLLCVVEDIGRH
jgi:FdhD protein